jgi:predicted dehydrogenase
MHEINWGIIGPGRIANKFASAAMEVDGAHLYAVASRSEERATEFANKYSVSKVYTDYGQLMTDPDVDIVYIATPHSFHYSQAKLCIEAGKHVLVEKPATINAAQMKHLVELANRHNVLLQEAIWSRFMPCLSEVKKCIERGDIGDIQTIQADIGFAFQHRGKGRIFDSSLGGGGLLDIGIYPIAIMQFLFEENPCKIQSMGTVSKDNVDENLIVNMQYPSGRYGQFMSSAKGQGANSMSIIGTDGWITLPDIFWDTDQAVVKDRHDSHKKLTMPHKVNGFEYQIIECMQCINQGLLCSDYISHQDSVEILETMDTIREQIGLTYPLDIETL